MDQMLADFVREVQDLYGSDLVAVFLYGSAAAGEHVAGRSDINVGIVLSRLSPSLLRKASRHVRGWARRGFATPMFFEPEFLRRAVDVFPIEFLDIRVRHRPLWGPDVAAGLRIETEALRRQCERELRGHLLKLRQAYAEASHSPKELESVLMSAASGLVALARALLHLTRSDSDGGSLAILDRVEARFGLRATSLRKAWQLKRGEIRVAGSALDDLYQAVLEDLDRLVRVVDELPT